MAQMPWDYEADTSYLYQSGNRSRPRRRTDLTYSGPWAGRRNSDDVARNRTFGSGDGGAARRRAGGGIDMSRYQGGGRPMAGSGSAPQREVQPRQAGPLPLTAQEIAAFADQRRQITKGAQVAAADAARQRAAALEAFKSGRFNLNRQAQMALRDVAWQAAGRGRGQARSPLQTARPMGEVDMQRQQGIGTLQQNLTNARAAAAAQKEQAALERDAALAKLEQQMALRRSLPAGFFSGMGG